MPIVPLDKLTVYGPNHCKHAVLDGLQQLGCMHLIHLPDGRPQQPKLVSREAREALRYLDTCPIQRRQARPSEQYDRDELIGDVLKARHRREELGAELDLLQKAVERLTPWGDFSLLPPEETGGEQFWFYVLPLRSLPELPDDVTWHVAGRDNQSAYIVVLSVEMPTGMPAQPVELDQRPLSQLQKRIESIEEEFEELHWQRVMMTRWRRLLQNDLDAADDKAAQAAAAKGIVDDEFVFAVQGWVPRQAVPDVHDLAERHQLAVTVEPAAEEDVPPTLLQNPERVAGAEGCVTFYITPGYHAWDPTRVVYFSFSLFFAMIVADAGYGLILAGLLLVFWRKLSDTRSGRQFRNLLTGIVSCTILYGVILGSYFGIDPAPGTPLDSLQVTVGGEPLMSQQTVMMVIAVAIGVMHLTLANTISAWQSRSSSRCLGHLGWALIMVGAFVFGMGELWEFDSLIGAGSILIPGGAVAVLLFSSERPLATRRLTTHLGRLLDGAMQFANVSKAFGDALSYLRLFALGLASAQLAVTFNGLAADASQVGGVGVLLALLILVVGHGINFLLGLMGGVVHGLRLNCIEFFNWSLTEEGFPFQPFKRKAAS